MRPRKTQDGPRNPRAAAGETYNASLMTTHFECTMCGKCCHDLKLPLSVDEAIAWLERGSQIQVLCEAVPWPEEPAPDNLQAQHKRRRSFAAMSGELPVRVVMVVAGAYTGPCPHLGPNLQCGIYEERPRVCRIYPAEINPFVAMAPDQKLCPPEAWTDDRPLFAVGHTIVEATTAALIRESRAADVADTATKARLCAHLGIDTAALSNEGLTIFSPRNDTALDALRAARASEASEASDAADKALPSWKVVSNRAATVDTLLSIGALSAAVSVPHVEPLTFDYMGFFPATV